MSLLFITLKNSLSLAFSFSSTLNSWIRGLVNWRIHGFVFWCHEQGMLIFWHFNWHRLPTFLVKNQHCNPRTLTKWILVLKSGKKLGIKHFLQGLNFSINSNFIASTEQRINFYPARLSDWVIFYLKAL